MKKEDFSNTIYWANSLKPKEYEIIEKYLISEAEKIPLPLEKEEYPEIVNFIKEALPQKKDFYITIDCSQYSPTSDGIIYYIFESRLTLEQEKILEQKLLQKFDRDEAYYKLGEACSTQLGEQNEFCIYEALTVKNDVVIIKMYSGKKYTFKRNYSRVKQLKEAREVKEKEKEKLWQEEIKKYEKSRQEKLEKDRDFAQKKGYLLSKDYDGELYDIQNEYNHPDILSWDKYESIKNSILNQYAMVQDLLKTRSSNITTTKFNKTLQKLEFITKASTLNQNDWLLKGNGLNYGINLIKMSKYMQKNIPSWYKVHIFDNTKMQLKDLEETANIKMTSIYYQKIKFNELCQKVSQQIALDNERIDYKVKNINTKPIEKCPEDIECPHCGSKNIHKKDKRQRKEYKVQRYQCVDCKKVFQIKIDEKVKINIVKCNSIENRIDISTKHNSSEDTLFSKLLKFIKIKKTC